MQQLEDPRRAASAASGDVDQPGRGRGRCGRNLEPVERQHTVQGSGADIFGAADEFHFVHQTLTGDGEIRARVNTMMNTQQYAKAGVMIRAGTATGAIHAAMLVTPTATNGYRFQWRPTVNFTMTSTGNQTRSTLDGTAPQYVRLVKSGNSYTGYHSANGSTWTQVGATQTLAMGASFQVGLALSSHADGTLNTATFDNVTLTGWTPSGPPAAPTGLGATAGNKQVSLSWTASTGATSYTVKRSTVAGGPYTALTPTTTTTSFTDSTVTNGTTYYYVASATNAGGESGNSSQTSTMPSLPAPAGLSATATSSQVNLSWSGVTNATGYVVKRGTTSGGPYSTLNPTTGTSFSDTTVASGITYYYVVSATSTGHEGANSTQVSGALPTPPAAPTNLVATAGNKQVAMSWTAVSGATSYTVKRSHRVEGPYTALTPNPTATSFTDSTVTNGTTYFYVVAANNAIGGGDDSNWVSSMPSLPAPTGLSASAGLVVNLSWSAVTNATGYVVKRSTTTGGPYTALTPNPTGTTFADSAVTAGTTYFYVVSATSTGHEGPNSTQVSATPPLPPAAPTNLADTAGNGQVALSWTASAGASSYTVKRSTVAGGPYTALTPNPTGTTFTDSTVTNGTTYFYVVSATNAAGEGGNSNETSGMPSLTAPTGFSATGGNAQVSLAWSAVTNATGYVVKRSTTSGGPYTPLAASPTGTTLTDSTVTNGTTYYYVVAATSSEHEGPNSAQASATPTAVVAPAAPSNLAATVTTGSQANLTWTDNSSNETGFRIERKVGAGSYATPDHQGGGLHQPRRHRPDGEHLHLSGHRHGLARLHRVERVGGHHRQPQRRRLRSQRHLRRYEPRHRHHAGCEVHQHHDHHAQRLPALLDGGRRRHRHVGQAAHLWPRGHHRQGHQRVLGRRHHLG